jgi:hypothetical protein
MPKLRKFHNKKHVRRFVLFPIAVLFIGAGILFWNTYGSNPYPEQETVFGMTFSTKYATELGLNWKDVYTATLDDLGIRAFRIPVYWDEVESTEGEYTFDHVEWMMDEAQERGAYVTLAIGNRAPRWPECHPPTWTANRTTADVQGAEMEMITKVVQEFRDHPALYRWQVHNEPFFEQFGECPPPDEQFIKESIQEVRKLDPTHPIQTTDSGELSTWKKTSEVADVLGVSMYRVTWNSLFKYFYYPLPPSHYQKKAEFVSPLVDEVIVSELQAEPWVPSTMTTTPLDEQFKSMDVDRFWRNVDYARRVGFSETYLWGVEWWYWLDQKHGDDSMWKAGKQLYSGSLQK